MDSYTFKTDVDGWTIEKTIWVSAEMMADRRVWKKKHIDNGRKLMMMNFDIVIDIQLSNFNRITVKKADVPSYHFLLWIERHHWSYLKFPCKLLPLVACVVSIHIRNFLVGHC